jgi:GGDEF domain-containing protein
VGTGDGAEPDADGRGNGAMVAADAAGYRIGPRALDDVARAEYEHLFDPGTGLPTRTLLYDRLLMALARTRRAGTAVGVFFLRPGGPVEDSVLVDAARALAADLRLDDTVARTGPAELVVVCHLRDAQEVRVVVRRFAQALRAHRPLRGMTVSHAAGAGGDDPGEVLIRAAAADPEPLDDGIGAAPVALPGRLRAPG